MTNDSVAHTKPHLMISIVNDVGSKVGVVRYIKGSKSAFYFQVDAFGNLILVVKQCGHIEVGEAFS